MADYNVNETSVTVTTLGGNTATANDSDVGFLGALALHEFLKKETVSFPKAYTFVPFHAIEKVAAETNSVGKTVSDATCETGDSKGTVLFTIQFSDGTSVDATDSMIVAEYNSEYEAWYGSVIIPDKTLTVGAVYNYSYKKNGATVTGTATVQNLGGNPALPIPQDGAPDIIVFQMEGNVGVQTTENSSGSTEDDAVAVVESTFSGLGLTLTIKN